MSDNNLKIQIIASLNTGLSIGELNTQIKAIEKKVNKLNLKVDIDDKVLQKLNNFTKQMKRISESALNPNKIVEEMTNLDGSKIKRTFLNGFGGAFEEIKKEANKSKNEQLKSIDEIAQGYDKLTKQVEKYNAVQKKIGETVTVSDNNGVNKRTINTNNQGKVVSYTDTYDKAKEQKLIDQQIQDQEKIKQTFASAQQDIRNSLIKTYDQGKVNEQFFKNFNKVINSKKNIEELNKVEQALQRVNQVSDNKALQTKLTSDSKVLLNSNSKGIDKSAVNDILTGLNGINTSSNGASNSLKKLESQLKSVKNEAKRVQAAGLTMGDAFKQALEKFPIWMGVSTIFFGVTRSVSKLVDTLYLLDERMVSINKVLNNANMAEVFNSATEAAYKYGQTIDSALESLGEISKLGFDQADAQKLNQNAMLLSTVGEFQNNADAANYLVAIMRQYKLSVEQTTSVVSVLNEVSNKTGADTLGLAQALSKSSSMAATAGVSFNELTGMVSNTIETLKIGGNEAGNFYKALFARYMRGSTQSDIEALGVKTKDLTGNLRSATDVIKELGSKWGSFSQQQKSAISESLGGVYHINKVASLLENQARVYQNTQAAINSYGSAERELATYQEGLAFKTNSMIASFQELAMTIGENGARGVIVKFLESVTFMVKGFTEITDATNGWNLKLPLLIAGLYGVNKALTIMSVVGKGAKMSLGWLGVGLVGIELLSSGIASVAKTNMETANTFVDTSKKYSDNASRLEQLAKRYDELKPQIKNNAQAQEQYKQVLAEISQIAPQVTEVTGKYGKTLDINRNKLDDYTESLKSMSREQLKNADAILSNSLIVAQNEYDKLLQKQKAYSEDTQGKFDFITEMNKKYDVKTVTEFANAVNKAREAQGLSSEKVRTMASEFGKYNTIIFKSTKDMKDYADVMQQVQDKENELSGIKNKQKEIKKLSEGYNENSNALSKVNAETQNSLSAYANEEEGIASNAQAKNNLKDVTSMTTKEVIANASALQTEEQSAQDSTNGIDQNTNSKYDNMTASERMVATLQDSVDMTNQMISMYQMLSQVENLSTDQKLALADATNYLSSTYPDLITNKGLDVEAMQKEVKANNVLLQAVKASEEGTLTAEQNKTVGQGLSTKARIDNIREEISGLQTLLNAYGTLAEASMDEIAKKMNAGLIPTEVGVKLLETKGSIANYEMQLDKLKGSLSGITTNLGKIPTINDKVSKSHDKNTKSTDKAKSATEQYTYISDKFKLALDSVNTAIEKQQKLQSKYPTYSKQYQTALSAEIKQLEYKKKLINDQAKSLSSQIKSGKIKPTGVLTSSEASGTGGSNKDQIWNFLASKGLSASAIAGIMGNIQAESTFNPNALGPKTKYGQAFGIAQWLGGRKKGLQNYAKSTGRSVSSLQTQLEYLWKELNGSEKKTLNYLMSNKNASASEIAKMWDKLFERSEGTTVASRQSNAKTIYNSYVGKGSKSTNVSKTIADGKQAVDAAKGDLNSLNSDLLQLTEELQQKYIDQIQANISEYQHQADLIDEKLKSKQLDAENLDPNSEDYRKNITEQIQLEKDKQKALSATVRIMQWQINNNKKLSTAQKDDLRKQRDEANNTIKEITNSVKGLNEEINNSKLNEFVDNIGQSAEKADKRLKDIEDRLHRLNENDYSGKITGNQDKLNELLDERKAKLDAIAKARAELDNATKTGRDTKPWQDEIKTLESELSQLNTGIFDQQQSIKDIYNSVADNYIESMKNAYEKAHDIKMKQLDEEGKKLDELYNKRLREIDDQTTADNYNKELTKKQKEAQDIQNQINKLSMDDSTWAKKQKADLSKQLADKEDEITQFQADRNLEIRKQSLQDEYDASKKTIDDKTQLENTAYDNQINDERYWSKVRQDILNGDVTEYTKSIETITQTIQSNSELIGTSIANNITDALKEAQAQLAVLGKGFDAIQSGSNTVISTQDNNAAKVEADRVESNRINKKAKVVALSYLRSSAKLSKNVRETLKKNEEVTYLGMENGFAKVKYGKITGYMDKSLLKFHEGGIVGQTPATTSNKQIDLVNKLFNVKPNEQITKQLIGEVDIPPKNIPNGIKNIKNMINSIIPNMSLAGNTTTVNMNINIAKLEGGKQGANTLFKELNVKLAGMGLK